MRQVVTIELSDGTVEERDASSWGHAASSLTPITFRISPNGCLVLIVLDDVAEAFAPEEWRQVRRDWVSEEEFSEEE